LNDQNEDGTEGGEREVGIRVSGKQDVDIRMPGYQELTADFAGFHGLLDRYEGTKALREPDADFGWIRRGRIEGEKVKNACQSFGFRLRFCKVAAGTEKAPDPVSSSDL